MKLTCNECGGSGRVECPCCNGEGQRNRRIDLITIPKDDPCYDELIELQKDANRVIAQCKELKVMNPQFALKYDEQMNDVLNDLDKQAEKVADDFHKTTHRYGRH